MCRLFSNYALSMNGIPTVFQNYLQAVTQHINFFITAFSSAKVIIPWQHIAWLTCFHFSIVETYEGRKPKKKTKKKQTVHCVTQHMVCSRSSSTLFITNNNESSAKYRFFFLLLLCFLFSYSCKSLGVLLRLPECITTLGSVYHCHTNIP